MTVDVYKAWPAYFEVQRRDLFFYERLWGVLLDRLERAKGHWLIEFGSGPGFLLKQAERRGWLATGIEPSDEAREHARSIGARCFSDRFKPLANFWNAAIATEVLEHVEDPKTTLEGWRDALVPGGLLALSVPNDENPLQRLFGRRLAPRGNERGGTIPPLDLDRPWRHPTHLHYFNPKSLKGVVESAGFEVIWQRTSFPVELFMVLPIKRSLGWKMSRLWPAPPLLWRFGIGRHCLLVARKI